jgi:integrase
MGTDFIKPPYQSTGTYERRQPKFSRRFREQDGEMKLYKNNWVIRYYVTDETGKRKKVAEPVPIKELDLGADLMERESYRRRKIAEINRAEKANVAAVHSGALTSMTIGQFKDRHWLPHIRKELRESTVDSYVCQWAMYCTSINDKPLLTFGRADGEKLLLWLRDEKGLGRGTVSRVKCMVSSLFRFASNPPGQEKWIPNNPFTEVKVKVAKTGAKRLKYSIATRDAVLVLPDLDAEAKTLFALCCAAGCRPGEAAGIEWECIDWKAGTLRIEKSVSLGGVLGLMKTEWSKGTVAITEPLTKWLKALWVQRGKPVSGLLFTRPDGKPIKEADYCRYHIVPVIKAWNAAHPEKRIEWRGLYPGRHLFHQIIWDETHDIMLLTRLSRNKDYTAFKHYLEGDLDEAMAAQRTAAKRKR